MADAPSDRPTQPTYTARCRTCHRVVYKRGPCTHCRVFGHPWEPTDRVEIMPYGSTEQLTHDRDRWRKEALSLREVYRGAMADADRLRERVRRAEAAARRLERVEVVIRRCRERIVDGD